MLPHSSELPRPGQQPQRPPRVNVIASRYLADRDKENDRSQREDAGKPTKAALATAAKRLSLPSAAAPAAAPRPPLSALPTQGSIPAGRGRTKTAQLPPPARRAAATPLNTFSLSTAPVTVAGSALAIKAVKDGRRQSHDGRETATRSSSSLPLPSSTSASAAPSPFLSSPSTPSSSSLSCLPRPQQDWLWFTHYTAWLQSLLLQRSLTAAHVQRRQQAERQLASMQRAIHSKTAELGGVRRGLARTRQSAREHESLTSQAALLARSAPALRTAMQHHDRLHTFLQARTRKVRLQGMRVDAAEVEAEAESVARLLSDIAALTAAAPPSVLLRLRPALASLASQAVADSAQLQASDAVVGRLQRRSQEAASEALHRMEAKGEERREQRRREEGKWEWGEWETVVAGGSDGVGAAALRR